MATVHLRYLSSSATQNMISPTATAATSSSTTKRVDKDQFRSSYPFFLPLGTRWSDNDQYGHVNNSVYLFYFDTVVNHYLIKECGLRPNVGSVIGVVAETKCTFFSSVSFPQLLQLGLRVDHIGKSSVRYKIGIFADTQQNQQEPNSLNQSSDSDKPTAAAVGDFVHVFVDATSRRPVAIPDLMRQGLERLTITRSAL